MSHQAQILEKRGISGVVLVKKGRQKYILKYILTLFFIVNTIFILQDYDDYVIADMVLHV